MRPDTGYQIIYADFPWPYTSFGTARLPYDKMEESEIAHFDWSRWVNPRGCVVFSWATCPRLDTALRVGETWKQQHGLHYQGVAFVWIKTRLDGVPIGASGPRPRLVKPLAEFVLAYSTHPKKRVFPLQSESVSQYVFAPKARKHDHSKKPHEVRNRIVQLLGPLPRVELFARERVDGWDAWGDQLPDNGASSPLHVPSVS